MNFRCDYCNKKMKLNDKAIYSDRLNSYYCSLKCLFNELDLKVDTVNEFIEDLLPGQELN